MTCSRRRWLLSAATVWLAGCTAVPLSTMWKFASFDRDAFLAIDPAQLRAAALTDERATMKDVTIKVTLGPKDGAPREGLIVLTDPVSRDARLPPAPAGRRWSILALTPAAQREFVALREAALKLPPGSSMTLGVSASEGTVPPDLVKRFPLRLDLQLNTADGWFTLLKDSDIDLTRSTRKA